MFLVVSVEGLHRICLEEACSGVEKVGAHLFMFWGPCLRIKLFWFLDDFSLFFLWKAESLY